MSRVTVAAALAAIGVASVVAGAAEAQTLRLSTQVAAPHPFIDAAEFFKEEVESRTGGEVTVRIFPNASLGNDDAVINEVSLGTIDLMLSSTNNSARQLPEIQIFDLYYIFPDYDAFNAAVDPENAVFQRLQEIAEERDLGFRFLALFGSGSRSMSNSVRPVHSVEDVQGMRMRVPPNQVIAEIWESFGTVPVTVAFPELYAAIQTGVAEAMELTLSAYYGSKVYEVAPYLSLTEHSINASYFIASNRTWDRLSPENQAIIAEVAAEAGRLGTQRGIEADQNLAQELIDNFGIEVTEPDKESFAELVRPVHEELAAQFGATDLLEVIRALQ